jgi:hypothetical protein
MYTLADLQNIGVDILGVLGVFLVKHIDELVFLAFVLIVFYTGVWCERQMQKKMWIHARKVHKVTKDMEKSKQGE